MLGSRVVKEGMGRGNGEDIPANVCNDSRKNLAG